MRLLFIADGRSPIALNWIAYFVEQGDEVHLVSTYPCQPKLNLSSLEVIPVSFSQAVSNAEGEKMGKSNSGLRQLIPLRWRTALRQRLGPLTLTNATRQLSATLARLQPDLVHAMRIPYEGMLAALAQPSMPLLISIWGNDFTLHAPATRRMRVLTRQALQGADALHADCQRDIRLAWEWGYPHDRPYRVLPGGGGIQLDVFLPGEKSDDSMLVINPRGLRAYVRNDTFFRAIPLVLEKRPETHFACPNMQGEAQAERWVAENGIVDKVELLPRLARSEIARLFQRAQVAVSPSTHDGTPNTLLEAMACGCFPVAGDLESLREWITPGLNGLLVDPADPQALAAAILQALEHPNLRQTAAAYNRQLILDRAEYGKVMSDASQFYHSITKAPFL